MDLTRTRLSRLVRVGATIAAIVLVAAYAAYRSLPYLRGPSIAIYQPVSGASVSSTTVTVIGRAFRTSSLALNGSLTPVDEAGNFRQTVIVFPGANLISFDATDQFKRSTRTELVVYGTQQFPAQQPHTASSSPARAQKSR